MSNDEEKKDHKIIIFVKNGCHMTDKIILHVFAELQFL